MINMFLNSDFDALSNERLLVEIFQVVPKLARRGLLSSEAPPPGTNVTKVGHAAEGYLAEQSERNCLELSVTIRG